MKKSLLSLCLATIVLFGVGGFSEKVHAWESFVYHHTSDTNYRTTDFSHIHNNPTSVTDSVTRSVTSTVSSTATVVSTATFNSMVAKVGVSTEVALGVVNTETVSVTWNIPPNSRYRLTAGKERIDASGYEYYWISGTLINIFPVSGDWSWSSYSDQMVW